MSKIEVDFNKDYGRIFIIEDEDYSKVKELIKLFRVYKSEYASGTGYVYLEPESARVEFKFISDDCFPTNPDDERVQQLVDQVNSKQQELYELRKKLQQSEEAMIALQAIVSPAHLLTTEEFGEEML